MPRRTATTERFLIGELLFRSGRALAYSFEPEAKPLFPSPPEPKSDSLSHFGRSGVPDYQPRAKSTPRAENRPWRRASQAETISSCCVWDPGLSFPGKDFATAETKLKPKDDRAALATLLGGQPRLG